MGSVATVECDLSWAQDTSPSAVNLCKHGPGRLSKFRKLCGEALLYRAPTDGHPWVCGMCGMHPPASPQNGWRTVVDPNQAVLGALATPADVVILGSGRPGSASLAPIASGDRADTSPRAGDVAVGSIGFGVPSLPKPPGLASALIAGRMRRYFLQSQCFHATAPKVISYLTSRQRCPAATSHQPPMHSAWVTTRRLF